MKTSEQNKTNYCNEGTVQNPNINELCRLCLTKETVSIDIFNNNENISLSLRIMACASLEVQPNDSLPKKLCSECRYQLEKSYVFRKKCKNSDTKLRRHLKLINSGKNSKFFDMSDDDDEDFADSMDFFAAREEEKFKKIAQDKVEREREFEERMKKYMEEERKRFHDEETNRIMQNLINEGEKSIKKTTASMKKLESKTNENDMNKTTLIKINEPKILNKFGSTVEINEEESNSHLESESQQESEIVKAIPLEEIIDDEDDDEETSELEEEILEEVEEDLDEVLDEEHNNIVIGASDGQPFILNQESRRSSELEDITISLKEDTPEQDSYTISTKNFKTEKREVEYIVDEENNYDDFEDFNQPEVLTDDKIDEEDIADITKAVKETLISQIGYDAIKNMQLKLEKRDNNITRVEVTIGDGSVITMEINNISKAENGELKVFRCTQCPKSFSRRPDLLRHSSVHIKDKGFICSYCDKWFPSKSSLDRHTRVHTGEKPFKCEICNRSFIQKEILKRHQMIHTGQKPFCCTSCDKRFTQSDMLRQHVNRKHSTDPIIEVHKCTLCPKTFCYSSGLSRHLLIHSGRVFSCIYCSKTFNDKSAVKRHEKNHNR